MDATILPGDCLEVLKTLPDQSVQCCVTSPPYWGLRDYGTGQWDGGDAGCSHVESTNKHRGASNRPSLEAQTFQSRAICGKCGARRLDQQIGLEPTPEQYVHELVDVFREVRRVLKDDGTLWLNLGDSYPGAARNGGAKGSLMGSQNATGKGLPSKRGAGLKPKDLVGIPWRVAFALQADGWYLRSDIIWHKPNPMPESVTDRPTKAHEYLFLLSKSERYYYDADAIAEPVVKGHAGSRFDFGKTGVNGQGRVQQGARDESDTRNKRSVWTIASAPYSEAHFATFPPKLIEPCILACCPPDGVVLDPFLGSGTTLMVAAQLGRRGLGIELNPAYIRLAEARLDSVRLPLLEGWG